MTDKYLPIYPLAYELLPGQSCKLYEVAFPKRWKEELLRIDYKSNPKHGLPIKTLRKLANSWMDDIVTMKPLTAASDDKRWLSSMRPFETERLERLYEIIRIWIAGTYINETRPPAVREAAKQFRDTMRAWELSGLTSERTVTLSNADGTVSPDAFDALPLLAANQLQKKELEIDGHTVHLRYAAKNELISLPLEDMKAHDSFSYVFHFSVQTMPPGRFALLLCDMSVRRWVRDLKNPEKPVRSKDKINAYIYLKRQDKYCRIPIRFSDEKRRAKEPDWKSQDKECYNLCGYEPLPDMSDLWEAVRQGNKMYLLPYKVGMWSFQEPKIGTGVSLSEKEQCYRQILELLKDRVKESGAATKKSADYRIPAYETPQKYASREKFREWVRRCAETDHITFELYGMSQSAEDAVVLDALHERLTEDFGENSPQSCLHIEIVRRESGDMALPLSGGKRDDKIKNASRIQRLLSPVSPANSVTACLFVLPGEKAFHGYDPKASIRHAFALTGRVTQFIQPKDDEEADKPEGDFGQRVKRAVYDLYRQIGVTTFINMDKMDSKTAQKRLADAPCLGMHVYTQVHGIRNNGQYLPVFVETDLLNGKTKVYCSAFERSPVNYREACLEMARLFEQLNLDERCRDASRAPAKEKLIGLAHQFSSPERKVILFIRSNSYTRALWTGISDTAISNYTHTNGSFYIPQKVDVGTQDSPCLYPLINTGVRVLRVRDNEEVPDYYIRKEEGRNAYSMVSGVREYHNTFWSIAPKPNDNRYEASRKQTRFDNFKADFAENCLIELYPLQLQEGDEPLQYVRYAHALRLLPAQSQYDKAVNLPLPLHLAKKLEEYLFQA